MAAARRMLLDEALRAGLESPGCDEGDGRLNTATELVCAVVSALDEAVLVCSAEGRLIAASEPARAWLRLPRAQAEGVEPVDWRPLIADEPGAEMEGARSRLESSFATGVDLQGCRLKLRRAGAEPLAVVFHAQHSNARGGQRLVVCRWSEDPSPQRDSREPAANAGWIEQAFRQSPYAIGLVDGTTGEVRAANARYREMAAWLSEADSGSGEAISILDPAQLPKPGEEEPGVVMAERNCRRLDGTPAWVVVRASRLPGTAENVVVAVDTTESRQTVAFSAADRLVLHATLASMTDAVFICDTAGRFVHRNAAFASLHRLARDEMPLSFFESLALFDIQLADGSPATPEDCAVVRALRGQSASGLEYRMRRRDTGEAWVCSYSYGPVRGGDGSIVGAVVIGRDITDAQQREQALHDANQRLQMALSASSAGWWDWWIEQNRLSFTPELAAMFGLPLSTIEADYSVWLGRVHPDDREASVRALRQAIERHAPLEMEYRVIGLAAEPRWARVLGHGVYDSQGKPVRVLGLCFDVTAARQAEQARLKLESELNQARKMESIGRLAGGVAHDFNNLLTIINGYSSLLLTRLRADDPLREEIDEIANAGARAAALTRQLLAFGRRQVLQPRALDLNRVLNGMKTMLGRLVGEDVELRFELAEARPRVLADPHQIEQVAMNLAVNARDAMPHGGVLTVETGGAEFTGPEGPGPGRPAGRYAWFSVADSGSGMDAATRERIFEPFFTTKGLGQGTGLGLATVLGIVEQSGGSIVVASAPGQGSRFTIYLPEPAEADRDAAGPAPAVGQRGSETILLVEDQAEVRNFTAVALRDFGYRVLAAASAGEAEAICRRDGDDIGLLLTDVIMPRVSGRELVERLGRQRPGLKTLYMSGYPNDEVVQRGVLESGAAFIQKPFTAAELAAKVRAVLDEHAG